MILHTLDTQSGSSFFKNPNEYDWKKIILQNEDMNNQIEEMNVLL